MICPFFTEPLYFFYVPDLPVLLYYSYLPAIFTALLVGVVVLWNDRKSLLNQLLFGICFFSLMWTVGTLIMWTNTHSNILLFTWSFLGPTAGFLSIFSIYFTYVFLEKKDIGLRLKIIFTILLTPLIIFAPSKYTLPEFDLTRCDAFGFEGPMNTLYFPALGVLAIVWVMVLLVRHYRRAENDLKRQIILMGIGIEFLLFSFFTAEFFGQFLTKIGFLPDSQIEVYGYFGMAVFTIFIGILIVRFKSFHVNLIATQALILALLVLIISEIAFTRNVTSLILISITLLLTGVSGFFLIRSVKREIELREEVEQLATNLSNANDKLKEFDRLKSQFLSMASHDLRAPLTIIRNFISLILEGAYGKLAPAGQEGLQQVFERATDMAKSVETYLDVSRIEQGRMKYDFIDIELLPLIENAVKAFTASAEAKGLKLNAIYDPALEKAKAKIDVSKMNEVLNNLLDNTIKYTPKGEVNVSVSKVDGIARFQIKDTGVGMSPTTLKNLFQLFSPGEDSKRINPASTGVGLYVTKAHVEAHKGKVWAESEGVGKGSTFIMELPLL